MKKYTHYKVSLLIGLLSLNTLSACVHTRQVLSYNSSGNVNTEQQLGLMYKQMTNRGNGKKVKIKKIAYIFILGFVIASVMALRAKGFGWAFDYFGDQSNKLDSNMNNDVTHLTVSPPFMPNRSTTLPYNMGAEEAQFIADAASTPKWNLVADGRNGEPDDGVSVKNPMVLDGEIMEDLMNDFSTKRIKYWLTKGLNINAKDLTLGYTLLMHAASYNSKDVLKFVISKGANVNAQNNAGITSLMMAVTQADHHMVESLISHKADPCIQDNQGKTARYLATNLFNKAIKSRIIKILDTVEQCAA